MSDEVKNGVEIVVKLGILKILEKGASFCFSHKMGG